MTSSYELVQNFVLIRSSIALFGVDARFSYLTKRTYSYAPTLTVLPGPYRLREIMRLSMIDNQF